MMVKSNIYKKRRSLIFKSFEDQATAILVSAKEKFRSNDVPYPYRQNNNFYYVTGFDEPNAILVVHKTDKNKLIEHFFIKKPNAYDEVWTGKLPSRQYVKKTYDFTKVDYVDDLQKYLTEYLARSNVVYHSLDKDSDIIVSFEKSIEIIKKKYRSGAIAPAKKICLDSVIQDHRLIKDEYEINAIKKSATVSSKVHLNLMERCSSFKSEKDIEIYLSHQFNLRGGVEAYPSIVASGKNACILHYTKNNSKLNTRDLLLVDAACEIDNYTSDITRTIPLSGKFSQPQKDIYNIVLEAQLKAIKKCIPGNTLADVHNEAVKWITKGLIKINLIQADLKDAIRNDLYKKFYMHGTGHWLGMDVHDPCRYKDGTKLVKLSPGMIFTVEPGIYIRPVKDVPIEYHNIGIRIEDDVLITKKGFEVLTSSTPKTINEIETTMASVK